MVSSIYIETSIISYLASKPSRDIIVSAHQQITHTWWDSRKDLFQLFISELVAREVGLGDPEAASRRLFYLEGVPSVILKEEAYSLAEKLITNGSVPQSAFADALHISVATVHGLDFLMTWNCRHIANAEIKGLIGKICRSNGYEPPVICTPEELMGGE